jgi:ATP-dependent protease HslVU (ClpYQ) peptidase subunit
MWKLKQGSVAALIADKAEELQDHCERLERDLNEVRGELSRAADELRKEQDKMPRMVVFGFGILTMAWIAIAAPFITHWFGG